MLVLHRRGVARCLLALPLFCCALCANAQQRLGAQQAVDLALARPEVRNDVVAGIDIARSEVLAARAWPNPALAISREHAGGGSLASSTETSVVLSQQFDLSGRRALVRRAAEQGILAATATADYERLLIRGEVLQAYYDAVNADERSRVQATILDGLGNLVRIADRRRQAGDLSGYESRRIAQAGAQAELRLAQADTEAQIARTRLAAWIGELALTGELDDKLPALPMTAEDDEAGSAELAMLDAHRVHAETEVQAARRMALPITLGVGQKRISHGGLSDDAVIVEFAVPLPLFDRNQAQHVRAAAQAQRAEARYQRAASQLKAQREAARIRAIRLSEVARRLRQEIVPEAARLTAIAQTSFAEGELDLVGLLDAFAAEANAVEQSAEQLSLALQAIVELELLSPDFHSNQQRNLP